MGGESKVNRTLDSTRYDAMVQMHRRLMVEGGCRQEAVAKWPAGNDEVHRDFCCAIRLDVPILPLTHRCRHTMCAPCNTRILTSASSVHVCPLCRAPIDDTEPSVQLRDIVERRYPLHVAHRLSTCLAERQPADEALRLTCTATSTGASNARRRDVFSMHAYTHVAPDRRCLSHGTGCRARVGHRVRRRDDARRTVPRSHVRS